MAATSRVFARGWPRRCFERLGDAVTRGRHRQPPPLVSIRPLNGNPHRSAFDGPSRRAPSPLNRFRNQSGSHWVQVHLVQIFFNVHGRIDLKRLKPDLPDRIGSRKPCGIRWNGLRQELFDPLRTAALPWLHESAELTCPRKPDQGMNVIWHDDKSDATHVTRLAFIVQSSEQDAFQLIAIQKAPAVIARKRRKMHRQSVVYPAKFAPQHGGVSTFRSTCLLLLRNPDAQSSVWATRGLLPINGGFIFLIECVDFRLRYGRRTALDHPWRHFR